MSSKCTGIVPIVNRARSHDELPATTYHPIVAAWRRPAAGDRCCGHSITLGRFVLGDCPGGALMTTALQFTDLTLGYNRQPAVLGLDASVREGSLTAIVGPNGAGKSTLLKGVTGALVPLTGKVVQGRNNKDNIAYLPQQSEIDRSFPISVADLIGMGLWREIGAFGGLKARHRGKVAEAISAVGLEGFERRSINSLSGGQVQRALFARLMLQDTPIVLLDEPFNAIDARSMADLIQIVRRWHDEGRTVMAVLHDFETVSAHFPESMMLARELVAHGPTHKVLTAENQFRARQMCEACATTPHTCGRGFA